MAIADGADSVRKVVREELRQGADQIKIMVSGGVASTRAVSQGVRTIEHGNLIDTAAAQLMAERGAYLVATSLRTSS
jgi:imidazolonepropionase-like amidohydrolase